MLRLLIVSAFWGIVCVLGNVVRAGAVDVTIAVTESGEQIRFSNLSGLLPVPPDTSVSARSCVGAGARFECLALLAHAPPVGTPAIQIPLFSGTAFLVEDGTETVSDKLFLSITAVPGSLNRLINIEFQSDNENNLGTSDARENVVERGNSPLVIIDATHINLVPDAGFAGVRFPPGFTITAFSEPEPVAEPSTLLLLGSGLAGLGVLRHRRSRAR
jgi:hypothetical protein